jgi:hypothetical protein
MSTPADTPAPTTPAAAAAERPKAERIVLPVNNQPVVFESLLVFRAEKAMADFAQQFDLLRQQIGRLQGIAQRREQALTTGEKDALSKVLEQEVRDLDSKDALFQKVYGFRVAALKNRPVKIQQTRRLLTPASPEELAKAKAAKEFKEEEVVTLEGKTHLILSTMTGLAFDEFMRNAQAITARRDNLAQFKQNLGNVPADQKDKAEAAAKEAEAQLAKDNEAMFKAYGFTLTRDLVLDFIDAKFFVALTQEDVQKAQAAGGAPAAAKAPEAKKDKPAKAN